MRLRKRIYRGAECGMSKRGTATQSLVKCWWDQTNKVWIPLEGGNQYE